MPALGLRIGIVAACITDADAQAIFLKSQSFKPVRTDVHPGGLFTITAYYVTSTLLYMASVIPMLRSGQVVNIARPADTCLK